MRKLLLLTLLVLVGGASGADKKDNVCCFYDESEVVCPVRLPEGAGGNDLTWQLSTPRWRSMAQGKVKREAGKDVADILLRFDKLKPGISLKCSLVLKDNGKIIAEQKIIIYSREIFRNLTGKIKSTAAFLPEDEVAKLNRLGMGLPEKASSAFDSPENKLIFCEAKKYLDNIGVLEPLLKRGVTLVILAPDDESEIFLPLSNFSKITLIAARTAKVNGSLSVICNKEKIAVACAGGRGDLVKAEYNGGEIVIVAAQVCEALDKFPEAALLVKENITK
ncbi:MAG: hypothetical protein PHV82_05380 [Victivallaceae bacterium]|nr:hypothetical protein [Victivallaceae bacterium]